jgi:hypothetical protein
VIFQVPLTDAAAESPADAGELDPDAGFRVSGAGVGPEMTWM